MKMQHSNIWALIICTIILILYIILMISMFKSNKIKLDSMFSGNIKKSPPPKNIIFRVEKRIFDIFFSLIVLISVSPMIILFAIFIKIEDHGPITYRMYCMGEYGRIVSYSLFRTMRLPDYKYSYESSKSKTLRNIDPRITNIGFILRKTGLDYIPMFLSVLKGDLTVIGLSRKNPQSISDTHKELFNYGKPGILSMSMISKPDKQPIDQETADKIYLQSIRFFSDIQIMLYAINNTYVTMTRNIDIQTENNQQQAIESDSKEKETQDSIHGNQPNPSENPATISHDTTEKNTNNIYFEKISKEKTKVVNLQKGQKISLDKEVMRVIVGLGWSTKNKNDLVDFDLDASAFLLGADGKVRKDSDFIFYSNLQSDDGSVIHTGDCIAGGSGGDDETLFIDFSKIPQDVQKIAITVTIYDAQERGQNFGQISDAYVHVMRCAGESNNPGKEELRYDLRDEFSIETALVVCEIYRSGSDWKFKAVGTGNQGGLYELCKNYGVNV